MKERYYYLSRIVFLQTIYVVHLDGTRGPFSKDKVTIEILQSLHICMPMSLSYCILLMLSITDYRNFEWKIMEQIEKDRNKEAVCLVVHNNHNNLHLILAPRTNLLGLAVSSMYSL